MAKDNAVVSNHGRKRTKERVGLSKKIADKNADKALQFGLHHNEAKGNLKRYCDKLALQSGKMQKLRIYNRHVYLFSFDNILITVFDLPSSLYALADKLQKQKNAEQENIEKNSENVAPST